MENSWVDACRHPESCDITFRKKMLVVSRKLAVGNDASLVSFFLKIDRKVVMRSMLYLIISDKKGKVETL